MAELPQADQRVGLDLLPVNRGLGFFQGLRLLPTRSHLDAAQFVFRGGHPTPRPGHNRIPAPSVHSPLPRFTSVDCVSIEASAFDASETSDFTTSPSHKSGRGNQ